MSDFKLTDERRKAFAPELCAIAADHVDACDLRQVWFDTHISHWDGMPQDEMLRTARDCGLELTEEELAWLAPLDAPDDEFAEFSDEQLAWYIAHQWALVERDGNLRSVAEGMLVDRRGIQSMSRPELIEELGSLEADVLDMEVFHDEKGGE